MGQFKLKKWHYKLKSQLTDLDDYDEQYQTLCTFHGDTELSGQTLALRISKEMVNITS